jgi:predicted PurR-regulated permease PerM
MRDIYHQYGSMIFIFLILFLSYLLIKPFLISIISAAIIAYFFGPVYAFFYRKTNKKNVSSFIMCILVILIVGFPSLYLISYLIKEIPGIYNLLSTSLQNSQMWNKLYQDLSNSGINLDITQILQSLMTNTIKYLQGILVSLPNKILNISLTFFLLFFFFRDGNEIFHRTLEYAPLNRKDTLILVREVKNMTDAVVYGQIITAFVQSILATIACFILGYKAPLVWGLLTFILSVIPMIGPAFVYVPLGLSSIVTYMTITDTSALIKGIIMLIFGFGIISSVDNVLKPLLISDKVRIHPVLVMLGIIGGLTLFGFMGIVLGPLILIVLITLFNIYDMKEAMTEHIEHPNKTKENDESEI